MGSQTEKQLQQSEIFFVLFLLLILAVIVLVSTLKKTEAELKKAEAKNQETKVHEKPPIITLSEASGYRFRSGSAELSVEFQEKLLKNIIPGMPKIASEFGVNVIEVIGHTDGQIISRMFGNGNMDFELEDVAHNTSTPDAVNSLIPASNVDLGLMRALSVIKFIQNNQEGELLREFRFRPYSAGQLLLPDGQMAQINRDPDANRRRIELRFTRF